MPYRVEQLGLGGILDEAIAIVKDHFGVLFTIVLCIIIPFEVLTGCAMVAITPVLPPNPTMEDFEQYEDEQRANALYQGLLGLSQIIYGLVLAPFANASLNDAIARAYLGQPVTARSSMRYGWSRLLSMLGTTILYSLAVMGGMILLIIPGILFALWFGLFQQVVVIEGVGGAAALTRSKQLVQNFLGTYLGLSLILIVISCFYLATLAIPEPYLATVVGTFVEAGLLIFSTASCVVLYFSCRSATEHFDLYHLGARIGASQPVVAVAADSAAT